MPSTRSQQHRTALTEELKVFIAAEVYAQVKPVADTLAKLAPLLDQLNTNYEEVTADSKRILAQLEELKREIKRALGIEPAKAHRVRRPRHLTLVD